MTDVTASIHQRVQARVVAQEPQAGTQTKTIILIIVARPIGNVQTNRDWTGSNHVHEKAFVHEISKDRYCHEGDEEEYVETEDCDRDPVQPVAVVWEVVQKNRDNTCAHVHGKP